MWSGPTPGLIHRWPLDLADFSAGVDADVVGSIGLTEAGTVTSTIGPSGAVDTARLFGGAVGTVATAASSPLPASGAYTVSIWAFCNNPGTQVGGFFPNHLNFGTNVGNQIRMMTDDGTGGGGRGELYVVDESSNQFLTVATPFVNPGWVHSGVTFDGVATKRLVLNGAVATLGTPVAGRSVQAVDVVGAALSTGGNWPGGIAQVTVYNRVLSAAELTQLYTADASTLPAFLASAWATTEW